jgi:hypothetical protein
MNVTFERNGQAIRQAKIYLRAYESLQKGLRGYRRQYGENTEETMQYQFRFTPKEIGDREAARHGRQTFYEHVVKIAQPLDLRGIVGDETQWLASMDASAQTEDIEYVPMN